MSLENHIEQLNRKHSALEGKLNEAVHRPLEDPATIKALKVKKLKIKDELAKIAK